MKKSSKTTVSGARKGGATAECEVRMITFMRKTRPTFVKAVASSSTLGSAANGVLAGPRVGARVRTA